MARFKLVRITAYGELVARALAGLGSKSLASTRNVVYGVTLEFAWL